MRTEFLFGSLTSHKDVVASESLVPLVWIKFTSTSILSPVFKLSFEVNTNRS